MKLALISGGSRGLGAALCSHYRDLGWRVIEYSRSGGGEHHVSLDLGKPASAEAILVTSLRELAQGRPPDELVAISNAAMLGPVGPASTLRVDAVLDNVAVNLAGGMLFMAAVLREFAATPCRKTLVNISSGAATRPIYGWSSYCAAKAGLERFVECAALEQRALPAPFTAINISPGVIDTGMQAEIRASDPAAFPDHDTFVGLKASGALRSPEQVAAAIIALVDDQPVNGHCYQLSEYLDQ